MSGKPLAAAALACLVLAGCASTDAATPERKPKTLQGAAKGIEVKGDGYTLRAPKGWGLKKVHIPGIGRADRHLFDLDDRDGFVDNVSVVLPEPDEYDADRMEATALNELGTAGVTRRRARQPVLVADDAVTHVSGRMTKDRVKYVVEQYYPVKEDQVYVVTFQFSSGLGRAARDKVADAVLNTWAWSDEKA